MKGATSRVIAGLFVFWLVVLLYMSTSLYSSENSVDRTERQLNKALEELDTLKKQNQQLQQLATELKDLRSLVGKGENEVIYSLQQKLSEARKVNQDLQYKISKQGQGQGQPSGHDNAPGHNHEVIRRKIDNGVVEWWYFVRSELNKIMEIAEKPALKTKISQVLEDAGVQERSIRTDLYNLSVTDGAGRWREQEAEELSNIVQRRLHYLQNPSDCSTAKKIVCNINKGCGYGCQLHHIVYCLIVAYGTQRTMVLESHGWRYSSAGWEKVFKPVSDTCTDKKGSSHIMWGPQDVIEKYQVIDLPIVDSMHPRPKFMPLSIPEDIAPRLTRLHGHPIVWWIGQFLKYLLRPQAELLNDLTDTEKRLGFKHPIVGVHVRRTDKVGTEAAFHGIEEYMKHVEEYFQLIERRQKVDKRRVYLATDDANLLNEAKKKYTDYEFVSDNEFSKSAGLGTRYSDASLRGIIMDIHFLSKSDYLVCTFSSQVCRVAYEIMQTLHPDASAYFHSLDDIYYYGGQNAHVQVAIYPHKPRSREEVELIPGDVISVAGNHWDGFSKGTNQRLGRGGLYPSYKVVDKVDIAKFPTYPEADKSGKR